MKAFTWLGNIDWLSLWLPDACLFYTHQRLIFYALSPLVLVSIGVLGSVVYHSLSYLRLRRDLFSDPGGCSTLQDSTTTTMREAALHGLFASLPFALVIVSFLVASVSARIFQARSCVGFIVDDATQEERFFLREDLSITCYQSEEHSQLVSLMWVFVIVWPVGALVLYLLLLVPCRQTIARGESTALTRSVSFLVNDYEPHFFFWEALGGKGSPPR